MDPDLDPGRPKKQMDPTDPDPQHCAHAQAASEKREAMEAKLRAKLEEEVRDLREEGGGGGGPGHAHHHHQQDTEGLLRKLSQAEEKVPRPRKCVCSSLIGIIAGSVANPGCLSRVRIFSIPDPGSKIFPNSDPHPRQRI
jgi:hypothetical protein